MSHANIYVLKVLQAILLTSGVFGIVAGAALMIMPRKFLVESTQLRCWLFEYSITAFLNRYHAIEKLAYRHHRPIGAVMTIGAVIMLTPLLGLYNHPEAILALISSLGFTGTHALILASWMLSIFALVIGILLFIRPSALKDFEMAANRWIELFPHTPSSSKLADRVINQLVLRAPRLVGLLLFLLGWICLLASSI